MTSEEGEKKEELEGRREELEDGCSETARTSGWRYGL
jgi:hypothetical protein